MATAPSHGRHLLHFIDRSHSSTSNDALLLIPLCPPHTSLLQPFKQGAHRTPRFRMLARPIATLLRVRYEHRQVADPSRSLNTRPTFSVLRCPRKGAHSRSLTGIDSGTVNHQVPFIAMSCLAAFFGSFRRLTAPLRQSPRTGNPHHR